MSQFRQQDNLLGQSDSFLAVLDQVSQLAPLEKPVLIIGERGTGKELIAARLHFLSDRWDQNYVKLNCAALNENLLESELFGHESGAFTGASKRHEGRFERANSGTLFLDELANTSAMVQEKLLRVIEYGEFERVGGKQTVKVDTRLVCATNEDLPSLAENGEFRHDLLDRLAFDVITLPPLRARKEDILLLAEHFAINMARDLGWSLFSGFTRKATETLLDYEWPGNIRELKNVIERSLYRHGNENLPVHQINFDPFDSPYRPQQRIKAVKSAEPVQHEPSVTPLQESTDLGEGNISASMQFDFPCDLKSLSSDYEIELLKKALEFSQFNQKKTAQNLGLTYHQLRGYLKKYNLLDSQQEV
ncbi:ATPase AAA [Pseudoalteromonas luteoviolacea CPMOR-2]|uniref:ATPase AAA n=1 Tax=Pseudoalteromonas luteoviolacea DSM 6061 TaxID=1365250 RepID=A0A166WIB0_9GAMM|nr:phage shock protein operon transcriptional activator [Pseudoalteromonas luteoviolacea]KZN37516.1 ATPase AAA [Pseudoalteromonas luteoviolacea DSM 6061]KZN49542.1 ATPase AAA [Pseudoalteromonas luteoviolacea CPMOR-2]MBE0387070.1 psp operon transcriptional activator [Pseudoalteromonas luteoviolacea DSM 6061]